MDRALARHGWTSDFPVTVLTGPVPTGPSRAVLADAPDEAWMDCWWAVDGRGGPRERDVALRMLIATPAAYCSVLCDGRAVAVGRAVAWRRRDMWACSRWLLATHRRRGLGRHVLHALGT